MTWLLADLHLLLQMVTEKVVSVLTKSITCALEMLSAMSGLIRFQSSSYYS